MTPLKHGFVGLCYHYIRPEKEADPFPRLMGNRMSAFKKHLQMLKRDYQMVAPDETAPFIAGDLDLKNGKDGVLITFDDGLADHLAAAEILAENGTKAFFFVPTCVLEDNLPANPTIIHYAIAIHGLEKFLGVYNNVVKDHPLQFKRGKDDPWKKIGEIKAVFKYSLPYNDARKMLLKIYEELLLRHDKNILGKMHLGKKQVSRLLELGHAVGVHSHTHISVAASALDEKDFQKEVVHPKEYLEKTFGIRVQALSYPFGGKADCLSSEKLIAKTKQFEIAFTVENILNVRGTPPLELGRYMPHSKDDDKILKQRIDTIIAGGKL